MDNVNFPTTQTPEELAAEITCLKAMLTLALKAIGQADGGRVILHMEKLTESHDNDLEAEVFKRTIQQIRQAYRQ